MAAPLRIVEVQGKADVKRFTHLPFTLYKNTPQWVPPLLIDVETRLNPAKHPFFQHAEAQLFLALRGDEVVGRISASVDRLHNEFWNETTGMFGWFECRDDAEAARGLVDAARAWVTAKGMTAMRGPLSFSTNDECGLLVKGFDEAPSLLMPYNFDYYGRLLESAGLAKVKDLYAWWVPTTLPTPERFVRMREIVRDRKKVVIRPINMKKWDEEVAHVKAIYNSAWERNWGFVPMTEAEMDHMAKDLKLGVDPRMVMFAEIDGEVVASAVTLPNMNEATRHANGRLLPFGLFKILWHKNKVQRVRVLTLGVKKEFRGRGIEAAIMAEQMDRARDSGYIGGEMSWTLEDNDLINRPIEQLGSTISKVYRLYEMPA